MATVFVYGSLKRGGQFNGALTQNGARFAGEAWLPGFRMFDFGLYPAAIRQEGHQIYGELWTDVSDACLGVLDGIEGVDRGFYQRLTLTEPTGREIYVYVFPPERREQMEGRATLEVWPIAPTPVESTPTPGASE